MVAAFEDLSALKANSDLVFVAECLSSLENSFWALKAQECIK